MPTRVLVIDDEEPIRLLCRVNLEAEGMEVLEAADGTTGVELAAAHAPDVILLDVMMPRADGWQVAEELIAGDQTREIPIIFLTARAELGERASSDDSVGLDTITKPFNPVDLAGVVHEFLDRTGRVASPEARRKRIADLRALIEPT
jgi:DNA-binding response OmpR family regulator